MSSICVRVDAAQRLRRPNTIRRNSQPDTITAAKRTAGQTNSRQFSTRYFAICWIISVSAALERAARRA